MQTRRWPIQRLASQQMAWRSSRRTPRSAPSMATCQRLASLWSGTGPRQGRGNPSLQSSLVTYISGTPGSTPFPCTAWTSVPPESTTHTGSKMLRVMTLLDGDGRRGSPPPMWSCRRGGTGWTSTTWLFSTIRWTWRWTSSTRVRTPTTSLHPCRRSSFARDSLRSRCGEGIATRCRELSSSSLLLSWYSLAQETGMQAGVQETRVQSWSSFFARFPTRWRSGITMSSFLTCIMAIQFQGGVPCGPLAVGTSWSPCALCP
mmetsp:Transcript_93447/g.263830  ORF Transcript_93447/g.263830 Transcript_93447/m.263830 type:complete len:260 (-) Transcript_93447:174-953(-)